MDLDEAYKFWQKCDDKRCCYECPLWDKDPKIALCVQFAMMPKVSKN